MPGLAVSRRLALTDSLQIVTANYNMDADVAQVLSANHQNEADNLQVLTAIHQSESDLVQVISALRQWEADALQVLSSAYDLHCDTRQIITFAYQVECDLEEVIFATFNAYPDILLRIMYSSIQLVRGLCHLITDEETSDSEVVDFVLKAQGRIDARLRLLYQIPLNGPVPEIINSIATDMAASFVLDKRYSDRKPDQTSLADVYMRRAEKDLALVIKENLLDGLPGIVRLQPPTTSARPAIGSTTPAKSGIEDVLSKW